MKNVNSLVEFVDVFKEWIAQNWAILSKVTPIVMGPDVYCIPDNPLFGVFNKAVFVSPGFHRSPTVNLSIINPDNSSYYIKLKKHINDIHVSDSWKNSRLKLNNELEKKFLHKEYHQSENKIQKIWEVVDQVFSSDFIKNNNLDISSIENELTVLSNNFPSFNSIQSKEDRKSVV